MKLSTALFLLASALVSAAPTPTVEEGAVKVLAKRASITDAANIGYATLNGGYAYTCRTERPNTDF